MKFRLFIASMFIGLGVNLAHGQSTRKNFSFDLSPGYKAGLINTDFLAFTRLRVDDLERFHQSSMSLFNQLSIEPRVRFGNHYFGLGIAYIFSKASYPNSSFNTLGASGGIYPSDLRYLSSSYSAISLNLNYEKRLRFKKGYLVPKISLGLGFVNRMHVLYEGINGSTYETNNTLAPSTLSRNPLSFEIACHYQSNQRRSGKGLMLNYKVGPYLGLISNAEFDQIFFLNGGLSLQFPFSF